MKVMLIKPLPGFINEEFNKEYSPGTVFKTNYTSPNDHAWLILLKDKTPFYITSEEKQCFKVLT